MDRGAVLRRCAVLRQWYSTGLCLLVATPGCGLVVGFEPRDLCDDCEDGAGGSGGLSSNTTSGDTLETSSGGGSDGGDENTSGSGGSDSSSGGTTSGPGGTTRSSAATSSSGGTTSDSGGTTSDSGGASSSGGTTSDSGGASSSGGVGGISETTEGTGGTTAGGTDGATETAAGGSGTGGSGGTGGTGVESPCVVTERGNATETSGTFPVDLGYGNAATSTQLWSIAWLDGNTVATRSLSSNGSTGTEDVDVTSSAATRSAPVVVTSKNDSLVAYGEVATQSSVALHTLHTATPDVDPARADADPDDLTSEEPPRVLAVAVRGNTDYALVAAIESSGQGLLALFDDGAFDTSVAVGDDLTSIDAVWLAGQFALVYVEEGSLTFATAEPDLGSVSSPVDVPSAAPSTTPEHPLSATALPSGDLAVSWIETDGVYLTTLDTSGDAATPVQVASGASRYPRVEYRDGYLAVTWLDADDNLYFRRIEDDLSAWEQPVLVASDVAATSYGFAVNTVADNAYQFGLVYGTDRLKFATIDCNP